MLGVCVQTDSMIKVLNGDLEDDDVSPFLIMLIPYRVLHTVCCSSFCSCVFRKFSKKFRFREH